MKNTVMVWVSIGGVAIAVILGNLAGASPLSPPEALEKSRQVVEEFQRNLRVVLEAQMKAGGPTEAIKACSIEAPGIATKFSQEVGGVVKRVSLKVRNPGNRPDAFERGVLERFEEANKAGGALEHSAVVEQNGRRVFRYMKAIKTLPLCETCHGAPERIPAEVKSTLAKKYPGDRATGFKPGDLRGAFSIQIPVK